MSVTEGSRCADSAPSSHCGSDAYSSTQLLTSACPTGGRGVTTVVRLANGFTCRRTPTAPCEWVTVSSMVRPGPTNPDDTTTPSKPESRPAATMSATMLSTWEIGRAHV